MTTKTGQQPVGLRWTIGNVSDNGWRALQLAIWGGWQVFGPAASYAVCVNSVPLARAREKTGEVPDQLAWYAVSRQDVPGSIRVHLDGGMAEGVAWKLAPLRVFPDRWEIALDNDCILWDLPDGMRRWLAAGDPHRCLLAEDATALYGRFARFCGSEPRNAGIRGLPPGYPLEEAVAELLRQVPETLVSELDEQGLQVAAVSAHVPPEAVSIADVSVCSPFPPHSVELGRCGAHFCGLNARHFPWQLEGRFAEEWISEHWQRHLPALQRHVALPPLL
jgi:hypothetical protein